MCQALDDLLTLVNDAVGEAGAGSNPDAGEEGFNAIAESAEFEAAFERFADVAHRWDTTRMQPVIEEFAATLDQRDFLGFSASAIEAFAICEEEVPGFGDGEVDEPVGRFSETSCRSFLARQGFPDIEAVSVLLNDDALTDREERRVSRLTKRSTRAIAHTVECLERHGRLPNGDFVLLLHGDVLGYVAKIIDSDSMKAVVSTAFVSAAKHYPRPCTRRIARAWLRQEDLPRIEVLRPCVEP